MTVVSSGPGKTAPKLLHDFLLFDPSNTSQNSNYLTDFTPPVGEGPQLSPPSRACKHDYVTKEQQSVLPPLDYKPGDGAEFLVAVICRKCRIHAVVHSSPGKGDRPCPNAENPLHHFQRYPAGDSSGSNRIVTAWQCSSGHCQARLRVVYRIQKLSEIDRHLLTNTDFLRRRFEAVVADDPSREGVQQATPIAAVSRLKKYVEDSLNPAHTRRSFPSNNKRFMEAFGVEGRDCAELLHRIGFRYNSVNTREWQLPTPDPVEDRLNADSGSEREALEDIEYELRAIRERLAAEGNVANTKPEDWSSAKHDIERCFAAQGYERQSTGRRTEHMNELVPYFFSLGAMPDFSDSLVMFAYNRQTMCDPENRSYHFECLQAITDARGTEQLQMEVATLISQDTVSRRDLSAAYRFLNIDNATTLSDERIIDKYQALLSDAGADTQERARQALQKIGIARASRLLINASRQELETYEDALIWLGNGVDKNTSDEALLAVVALKTGESPADDETALKAISIISKARKSNQLNSWLSTGQMDSFAMSTDEAARYLGIEQSVENLDRSILPAIYEGARADRPGDTTEKAIAAIQQALMGSVTTAAHSAGSWPVGLTSHGNTCYLNSLLQYYFSVKPIRSIVLNYDDYKFDTARFHEKTQRVGRLVSMTEIKGGQRFAADLKHLFERMIKDPGQHVKPEEDLVCRAFLKPEDYALLGEGKPQDAASSTTLLDTAIDEKLSDDKSSGASVNDVSDSMASSETLQASAVGDSQDTVMKTTELPPTPPASPRVKTVNPDAPVAAPPLPPRRFSTSKKEEALRLAETKARQQQDVAEVHDEIMFRLRSGMKPNNAVRAVSALNGTPSKSNDISEQEDDLRDLFLIGLKETAVKDGVDGEQLTLAETDIQTSVPETETDIYSALDQVFDLQAVGDKLTKYRSIRTLPPLLQINTPRIGFDRKRVTNYKSDVCMKLYDELYLDRYCDDIAPEIILPKRKRCWAWRKQLRELQREATYLRKTSTKDVNLPEQISEVAKYLASITAPSAQRQSNDEDDDLDREKLQSLQSALVSDANEQAEKLSQIDQQITAIQEQLEQEFADLRKIKYRLAAVFFHRGGTSSGHYWVYIHDFHSNVWRRYNDEHVEEFTQLDEIFEARHYNHGTPTYAVYVRDELKTTLIEPVCREVELAHPEISMDADEMPLIEMDDDTVMVDEADSRELSDPQPPALQTNGGIGRDADVVGDSSGDWDEVRSVPGTSKW